MKAVQYYEYGGPEVLRFEEVPVPEINSNEVLIKVVATGFNQGDALIRNGYLKDLTPPVPPSFPFIPNCEVSGVIEKIGESVKGLKIGDKVFSYLDYNKNGAAAEYVAVRAEIVLPAPKSISLQDAGACAASSTTAFQGLFVDGNLQAGQRILITACAGGVGSFAVQFAKWKGAYVIGTDAEDSFPKLKELGIDEIYDYTKVSVEDIIKENKVDMILNLAHYSTEDLTKMLYLINKGGALISSLNPADENVANELGVKTARMWAAQDFEILSKISELIDFGHVKPWISERMPLSEIKTIHEIVGKTHGKILIVVNDSI